MNVQCVVCERILLYLNKNNEQKDKRSVVIDDKMKR